MPPRASDLSQYNRHENIRCAGPRSLQVKLPERVNPVNFPRDTLASICDDNQVFIRIASDGTFPHGWAATHGFNSLTRVFNESPEFEFKFCTVRKDDSVTVPDNRPPRIDDLIPPLPLKYKNNDTVAAELERKRVELLEKASMKALANYVNKEEKMDAGKIIREEQKKIKRGVKDQIDEDRIYSRQRLGKSTTITSRGFGPYPTSILTTPSRRESATSKARKSRKERKGTPSLNPDAAIFYPVAGPSNAPAAEPAALSTSSVAPQFTTSSAYPPPPSIPSATLDDYEMEGGLPDGDDAAVDEDNHEPDDEDTAMPAV